MSEINAENFPSNSHASKQERREVPKVVTKGTVVTKKPGIGRKLADTFFGDDIENIGDYILLDIIVPSIKETIVDMVSNGIEMLFGVGNRRSSKGSGYHFSYSSISSGKKSRGDNRENRYERRRRYDGDDVVVETRGQAEEIISNLDDLCKDYGMARVADLYDMVGITPDFTAEKWGWESVASARALRQRGGGYLIQLPKPIYLE